MSHDTHCTVLQPRDKQVEIDQLQYELGVVRRRTDTEVASLRQRVADLELQVTEARKEADEYYRASVERNTEATALAQQVNLHSLLISASSWPEAGRGILSCRKILFSSPNFGRKMLNLGLKHPILGNLEAKLKILSTHSPLCWKFVVVCWNTIVSLECSLDNFVYLKKLYTDFVDVYVVLAVTVEA